MDWTTRHRSSRVRVSSVFLVSLGVIVSELASAVQGSTKYPVVLGESRLVLYRISDSEQSVTDVACWLYAWLHTRTDARTSGVTSATNSISCLACMPYALSVCVVEHEKILVN